jgi:hypothetical protein
MKRQLSFISTLCTAAAVILLFSCTGYEGIRKDSPAYKNRHAQQLLERSIEQLESNEFTPAITDVVKAGLLCEDDELAARIQLHREDIFNHVQVLTSVEGDNTLKYTLLYKREDVFYPIDNMNVRFTFLQGSGVMDETARTNATGTAESKIEKVTSLRNKFIIESVPFVAVEGEQERLEELHYNYIVANRGGSDNPKLEHNKEVVIEAVGVSVEILGRILDEIFGD